MRVIAGTYRSRMLQAPPGSGTRPTSDRLRETLFNILAPRMEGCRFVDLYAGSGAVGIEAISRGAVFVWFAENGVAALKSLRANLAALKIAAGFALEDRGVGAVLQRVGKLVAGVDVVYVDPPYEAEAEYAGTLAWLGSGAGMKMLAEGAVVVVEHASRGKFLLAEQYGGLLRGRVYRQGESSLSFYSRPPKGTDA